MREIAGLLVAFPELVEDDVLRADMVEGATTAFEFLSRVVRVIGTVQATAAGTAEWIAELDERRARLERRETALRKLIFAIMNAADLRKAELPEATLSVRAGSPRVVIINEHEIPEEFIRVKREPDRARLAAALKAHEHVPGATLSNGEPSLTIRVR